MKLQKPPHGNSPAQPDLTTPGPVSPEPQVRQYKRWVVVTLNALLAVVLIAAGLKAASYIRNTAPQVKARRPLQKNVTMVRTQPVKKGSATIALTALGKVVPARQVTLKSQTSGTVIKVHPAFIPGGRVRAGDELLRIDPRDYELAIAQKKGQVARAKYELQLEQGRQEVARRELELIDDDLPTPLQDRSLALRKPHLEKAQAEFQSAMADLEKARLNLKRTRILASFNAVILERNTNLGALIGPQDRLATLADTDAFWIQASLPMDRLQWIRMPSKPGRHDGSKVQVRYGANQRPAERSGTVLHTLGDIEPEGHMARVLIRVPAPLDNPTPGQPLPPLLIGSSVSVEISGPRFDDIVQLPRSIIREGDRVWLLDPEQTLEIREIDILWKTSDTVWVSKGLSTGEQLIISDIGTPVAGMPLKTWQEVKSNQTRENRKGPNERRRKKQS